MTSQILGRINIITLAGIFLMAVLVFAVPGAVLVYADQGDLINIGPPFTAQSMATILVDGVVHIVYQCNPCDAGYDDGIYYATVNADEFGQPSGTLNGPPQLLIPGGTNSAIVGGGSGGFSVVADGETESLYVPCLNNEVGCGDGWPTGTDAPTETTFASGVKVYTDEDGKVRDSRNTVLCEEDCSLKDAYVVTNSLYDTIPGTQWISYAADGGVKQVGATYTTTFKLPPFFTNPSIAIELHADNVATVRLNDEIIGQQTPDSNYPPHYQNPPDNFSDANPDNFRVGINVLEFEVKNYSGPSGLDYKATVSWDYCGETCPEIESLGPVVQLDSPTVTTTDDCNDVSTPRIAVSGSELYIVQEECTEIIFYASHNGGVTFVSPDGLNLSNNDGISEDPRVAITSFGTVVVTWQDNTPGNEEIFYSRSTDQGATWNGGSPVGSPINLSVTSTNSYYHQMKAEGDNVYVVWVDLKTGNGDIYFRASTNDGVSFGTSKKLSSNPLGYAAVRELDLAAQGTKVAVVWSAQVGKTSEPRDVFFRESINEGGKWGNLLNISKNPSNSTDPQTDYTEDGERYMAWLDNGGPARVFQPTGTFAVLVVESEDGKTFTAPVNQTDDLDNLKLLEDATLLEVVGDVATWDPTSRRG